MLVLVGAASGEAAEGIGQSVGAFLVAAGEAALGGPAPAEQEGHGAWWSLRAPHGLGQRVKVSELFVKQLHNLTRELGEEVAVNLAAQPREAGGTR